MPALRRMAARLRMLVLPKVAALHPQPQAHLADLGVIPMMMMTPRRGALHSPLYPPRWMPPKTKDLLRPSKMPGIQPKLQPLSEVNFPQTKRRKCPPSPLETCFQSNSPLGVSRRLLLWIHFSKWLFPWMMMPTGLRRMISHSQEPLVFKGPRALRNLAICARCL